MLSGGAASLPKMDRLPTITKSRWFVIEGGVQQTMNGFSIH
jgi:hypothetical protein